METIGRAGRAAALGLNSRRRQWLKRRGRRNQGRQDVIWLDGKACGGRDGASKQSTLSLAGRGGRRELAWDSGRCHNVANLVNVTTYPALAYKRDKAGLRFSSFRHAFGYHGGNARASAEHFSLFCWERSSFAGLSLSSFYFSLNKM